MYIGFSGYSIALPVLKCMIHVFLKKKKTCISVSLQHAERNWRFRGYVHPKKMVC